MNQKQEKAYIKPLTTFVVISEKECILNSAEQNLIRNPSA